MAKFCFSPAVLAALSLSFAACSGSSSGTGDAGSSSGTGDAGSKPSGSSCSPDAGGAKQVIGAFNVKLVAPVGDEGTVNHTAGFTSIMGKVSDGPEPSTTLWVESSKAGSCTLLTPSAPFCSKPCSDQCGASAACVAEETCQLFPTSQSAGTVTATGVRTASSATIAMEPTNNIYQPTEDLPFPAFNEGDDLRFVASGSAKVPAFSVASKGIKPLVLGGGVLTLVSGQPLALTWTKPDVAGISAIHVKLDISHHGGARGVILCDAQDTGSLDLPATLVTALLNLGAAGYPTIVVTRSAVASTAVGSGMVELQVTSSVERAVQIPGLVSCTKDQDCPTGKSCRSDLTCG